MRRRTTPWPWAAPSLTRPSPTLSGQSWRARRTWGGTAGSAQRRPRHSPPLQQPKSERPNVISRLFSHDLTFDPPRSGCFVQSNVDVSAQVPNAKLNTPCLLQSGIRATIYNYATLSRFKKKSAQDPWSDFCKCDGGFEISTCSHVFCTEIVLRGGTSKFRQEIPNPSNFRQTPIPANFRQKGRDQAIFRHS